MADPVTIDTLCESGLIELQTGPFGSQLHAHDYVNRGVPVVPTEAIRDRRIDHEKLPHISEQKADELARHRLQAGDILFARRGVQATGQSALVRKEEANFICGTGAIRLRVAPENGRLLSNFLSHVLMDRTSREWIRHNAIGATMPNLNEGIIRRFAFSMPPIEDQIAITVLLDALDDKIELSRRMNETLEAMARTIFKDWFVDFGPTRAKMEGRAPYLAPHIWSLFPDGIDDEGKPDGWKVVELGQVTAELRRGISPTYVETGGVRVLNQKCVRGRQIDVAPSRRHDSTKRTVEGREVRVGDILVNSTGVGTLGRTAQIWKVDEVTVVDSHVTVVRPDTKQISPCYLGLDLTGREKEIEALGEGSTGQTELARTRLATLPVLLSAASVQHEFNNIAQPLLDRLTANLGESNALAALRDLLLPKLMSGEIRIKDAEKMVGEAV